MRHSPFFLFALMSLCFLVFFSFKFLLKNDSPREQVLQEELVDFSPIFFHGRDRSQTARVFGNGRRKFFPSKDVIVRAVYFDDRPRYNHRNTSVFLALIWKELTDKKLVSGCQVGEARTNNFTVKLIGETKMWRIYPKYNVIDHEEALVHCYDLPSRNGSEAYLYYKLSENATERRVKSERPIHFPAPRIPPTSDVAVKYNLTVLACTKVFGDPPWLREWLDYQRGVGVDHVHLIGDESFFRGINKEMSYFLEQLMAEGFLSVDLWILWLKNGKEVWYHNQGLILEDCVYQFRGTYDYVFILDTDDFFVPRVPGEPHAQFYIDKLCSSEKKGTCKFRWIEFYPEHFGLNSSVPLVHGNVTSRLINYTHLLQGNRKSVHRTQAVVDTATHYAFELMPTYSRVEVSLSTAYVAHMRKGKKPDAKALKGLP